MNFDKESIKKQAHEILNWITANLKGLFLLLFGLFLIWYTYRILLYSMLFVLGSMFFYAGLKELQVISLVAFFDAIIEKMRTFLIEPAQKENNKNE
jgi:hypothetical protein